VKSIGFLAVGAFALTAALSAHAQQATLNWTGQESPSTESTAIIRAALKDEKIEQKANAAVRIFVNAAGRGSIATLLNIRSQEIGKSQSLKDYGPVQVTPGIYTVQARCYLFPFVLKREIEISTETNGEYLIECAGQTAHSTHLIVHEIKGGA
jgi:hypothetical protein